MTEECIKVSVAMCTYNGALYLRPQLDSILAQTYGNIELVIFDDCSQDNTLSILREYEAKDSRVRVYQQENNVGFVRNFDNAIAACRSDFIALADQDDVWFDNKIAQLMSEIGDMLLIYSRVSLIDAEGHALPGEFPGSSTIRVEGSAALSLVLNNCVTGHASLIRRELFDLSRPALTEMPFHDQWLAIVAAAKGRLKASDEVLSLYRSHGKNVILKDKIKRVEAKHLVMSKKFSTHLDFLSKVLDAKILDQRDEVILQEYFCLYAKNHRVLFNFSLWRFLKKHKAIFLTVKADSKKNLWRMCRGKWFFVILPFS
jgi:glycosyltransferase involved in cell wall biosynthesis